MDVQVAFFLPQLVQQLRGDDNSAVRQFLLDGAKSSRLFAHHLVGPALSSCSHLLTVDNPPPAAVLRPTEWARRPDEGQALLPDIVHPPGRMVCPDAAWLVLPASITLRKSALVSKAGHGRRCARCGARRSPRRRRSTPR